MLKELDRILDSAAKKIAKAMLKAEDETKALVTLLVEQLIKNTDAGTEVTPQPAAIPPASTDDPSAKPQPPELS